MLRTVSQLKLGLAGLLTGTNLSNITDLDGTISRSARHVAQKIDAPEATGREPITLYGNVYYYRAPESIFGTAVNIIRPQGNVNAANLYSMKVPMDVFTRGKFYFPNGYMLDLEYNKGQGIIGVSSNVPIPQLNLATMNDSSDFTAGGSASGLVTDSVNFYQAPGSLRFNLAGASTGTITGTIESVDMTSYEGVGVVFLAIETPNVTNLTNVAIRVGSSSTNYFEMTETEGFLGAWTVDTWTLVALDLSTATETGTVDVANVDYLQARITTSGSITNFRLGGCWVSMPSLNEIIYQTAAFFKDSTTGALSQDITSDNNLIILNDAAYSIFELECAKSIAMDQSGGEYTTQIKGFDSILLGNDAQEGLYQRYSANNPSNQLRQIDSYYDPNERRYGAW